MEICDALKLSEPFNSIPNAVLNQIGEIAELVPYKQGDIVYETGSEADTIYIILSGKVKRRLSPPITLITQEKIHSAGEVIGWLSLFQDMPYGLQTWISTTVCLQDSVLIKIDSRKFEAFLENHEDVRTMLRERHAETIADSIMLPGGAISFVKRGDKKIPVAVPHWKVDRLLNNPQLRH
jgi:CRP-like cAMP-binding protein